MKKVFGFLKNRTLIGIACIIAAALIAFVILPIVTQVSNGHVNVLRVKNSIPKGHVIEAADIETVSVGAYGLPEDTIKKQSEAVGLYASVDMKPGDYLFPSKLTAKSQSADSVFRSMDGDRLAVSVTIDSFAAGLSGKLENGDIVSLGIYKNNSVIMPDELRYVRVITTTTINGTDKDEDVGARGDDSSVPATVTLLVNQAQAAMLVDYENSSKIHVCLVYRGLEERAEEYLAAQDEYFRRLREEVPEQWTD